MATISSRWTKHAKSEDEKLKIRKTLSGSRGFIKTLREVLKNVRNELENERSLKPKYEEASWPYRQAHLNGSIESIDRILGDILPTDQELSELRKDTA